MAMSRVGSYVARIVIRGYKNEILHSNYLVLKSVTVNLGRSSNVYQCCVISNCNQFTLLKNADN
jgi:hypothetical protein